MRGATPALLFGLRLWASVCLSFYVAFALELSEPSWAATTAALVCQPVLGASLRKSMFRMIGTVIGAIAIVILAAFFRQDRVAFLVGLALWCAASAFVATLLRNFAAYAAALAGYTAAIIAIDVLGPVGSTNGIVFIFAIDRALEICIGIVSAGVVLALTDLGHSRRKLATEFAALSTAIMDGFADCFVNRERQPRPVSSASTRTLAARHRARSDDRRGDRRGVRPALSFGGAATGGVGPHGDALGLAQSYVRNRAQRRLRRPLVRPTPFTTYSRASGSRPTQSSSTEEPAELREACCSAVRSLTRFDAETPMQRLLADNAAVGMLGMARALNGLTGVIDPRDMIRVKGRAHLHVADWLPAFVNAVRVLFAVGAISLFWIVSAWPNGVAAITFCAVIVILLPLQGDLAYSASMTVSPGKRDRARSWRLSWCSGSFRR